ncbi:hypothetical protein LO772_29790 [Yinghuangia sp. ASG 101]|uniref:hypothetical protein n=1 Tax=Yinghuangia sp. ASG 101 TaxID=2896848 RepID=UPI001E465401|nr:hypothetical protein [Yinghuangia sp. ASG 101]UGQ10959.1 hypothetical protein LO772_29790 [Yinghuangia sp. ASG 101]
MNAPGTLPPGWDRARLTAALGLLLEARLRNRPEILQVWPEHPWDRWWLAMRTGTPLTELPATAPVLTHCPDCVARAALCAGERPPSHPGDDESACACRTEWATAMRASGTGGTCLPRPPQRLTLALLKPGSPAGALRARLRGQFTELACNERTLTARECARLYPDAYGQGFVAERTRYLTSGPVQVLVLLGPPHAVDFGDRLKHVLRLAFEAGPLINHLHMPDNPAEALADIALLAGADTLAHVYERWEHDDRRHLARMASYRTYVDRPGPGTRMAASRRGG